MNLYKQFATSLNLEKDGVLIEYGENSKGKMLAFRVARAGGANTAYKNLLEQKVKPMRRQIQTETVDQKKLERAILEVFCKTIIIGWENVEDAEGQDMPYSYEAAVKLFTDLPDLFADLQEQAQKSALFRQENLEADAKN